MASVVGALRVVLSADTAEFKSGLDQATKLTGDFSGKLTGLQAQVQGFSKVFGTMFTVGAIGAAAKQVLDYAGNLQDLADQTGLTAEALQEMDFAAKQTGKSLEGFTAAAFKLGTNLAESTLKIQGGVEALGLSYTALKAASPDEQFRQTAIALSKIEDVQERNRLGVLLMGKGYKEVAAAINSGYDELASRATKSSDAQIKALSDAGDEWDRLKSRVLGLGVTIGGSFAKSMEALGVALKQDGEFLNEYVGIVRITQQAVEDWKSIFMIAAEGPPIFGKAIKDLPAPLANASMSMDEAEAAAKKLDAQVAKSIETNKAAAKAAEEFAAALKLLSGTNAATAAKEVVKQLEAMGGPLKVLPSQLESMAAKLRDGAEAALLVGDADLAGQYTKLAATLNPIIQFQQRFNVTIGEFAFETNNAAEMTEDMWEQLHRLGGTVTEIGPLLENKMVLPWVKFKATIKENETDLRTWADTAQEIFGGVPQAIVNAIQGGGSIISAAGASIGVSLMSKFQSTFGPLITKALPFGIGEAINALLPTIGALFGPVAQKIGGFFKKIFGGPSDEEMRGRESVAAFEDQLESNLTAAQRAEAGNEDWKKTVIAIRDAYLATGHTEAEAMAAAERLWQSSKKGASETEAAIAAIQAVLDAAKDATDELGASMDNTFRDRSINVDVRTGEGPASHGEDGEGYATGTMGRLGKWFGNFPTAGLNTALHGVEAVVTPDQAPAFAMDVLSRMGSTAQATPTPQASGRQQVHVELLNTIVLDGQEMKKWHKQTIVSALDNNEDGFRTDTRGLLGVTG